MINDTEREYQLWWAAYIEADVDDDQERKEELLEHPGQLNPPDDESDEDEQ